MTADVEHDEGDDDRRAAEPPGSEATTPPRRPAPSPDRLISWGAPPERARPEAPAVAPGDLEAPSPRTADEEERATVAPPPSPPAPPPPPPAPPTSSAPADETPAEEGSTDQATTADTRVDATPPDWPPPDRSPLDGPVEAPVDEPAAKPEATTRTWSSPTIAAPPARADRPAGRDLPRRPPSVPRVDRSRERATPPPARSAPAAAPASAATVPGPATPAPSPAAGPAKPVSITELAQQLSTIQTQLGELSGRVATTGTSRVAQQMTTLHSQLNRVGEQLGRAVPDPAGERRAAERTAGAITELSQQLAATQAQVASLSAQLTTLAHRITYDLERAGQATSERLIRDLPQHVAGLLGPAVDDLTDQIEADRARLTEAVEVGVGQRLAAVGEVVDGLPLANVELMTNVQSLEADLEDRFTRLTSRLGDQITALEQSNGAELARLREHVLDLQDLGAVPATDRETIERMAGQVERLSQRATGSSEVVDAVELLIAEHLEVLRDDVETRVAALGPMLQEELEAVRAESVAGVGATEEALAERIDALEANLTARLDAALAEQVDSIDGLVAEQLAHALGDLPTGGGGDGDEGAALAAVTEELKALRRRITLRLEGGDAPAGLSPAQLDDLAELLAKKLEGRGPAKVTGRAPRAVKKA